MWAVDAYQDQAEAFHFQTTHVQTGEVTYFRTIESVGQYIERLAQTISKPPIEFSDFRQRSDNV
jgi:hypothetical protein